MPSGDRVLGLDYGARRVGVAVSDGLRLTAQPHSVIDVERENLVDALAAIIEEYGISLIIVGLPTSLDGGESEVAKAARAFAASVAENTGLPVELFDERFTTKEAERVLLASGASRSARRQTRDKLAAVVLLQGYLDGQR